MIRVLKNLTLMFMLLTIVFCNEPSSDRQTDVAQRSATDQIGKVVDTSCYKPSDQPAVKSPAAKKERRKKGRILQSALENSRFDAQKWLEDDPAFPPPGPPGKISRYDPLVKKMARRYGFDWRLIAAQIFVESRFDSCARSHCGALGLMQVMPKTAQHFGASPLRLEIPEVNIATGCLYDLHMVSLWKRNTGKPEQQLAFAFASYNAGRGRVLQSFSVEDSLTEWKSVHPLLPEETQDYVHRIALKHDFYGRHALP